MPKICFFDIINFMISIKNNTKALKTEHPVIEKVCDKFNKYFKFKEGRLDKLTKSFSLDTEKSFQVSFLINPVKQVKRENNKEAMTALLGQMQKDVNKALSNYSTLKMVFFLNEEKHYLELFFTYE